MNGKSHFIYQSASPTVFGFPCNSKFLNATAWKRLPKNADSDLEEQEDHFYK